MKRPKDITIVIPAYNEEKNIRLGALDKVSRYLEKQRYSWEVILVNDGSTDKTEVLITSFIEKNRGFTLINNPHQGKAATVITGIQHACGDIVLFSDLDQATPLSELDKLLPYFQKGYDVIIGSRNSRREGAPLTRILMARGFMIIRSVLLGLEGITDTQCGFKAFRREAVKAIFLKLSLYGESREVTGSMVTAGFDIEILFVAKKLGYAIKEVPVEWHYVETRRVNPISDSFQALGDIIRIRLNAMRGRYD